MISPLVIQLKINMLADSNHVKGRSRKKQKMIVIPSSFWTNRSTWFLFPQLAVFLPYFHILKIKFSGQITSRGCI